MKYNTSEVATLQPDYLGFIFYEKSPRNFDGEIPEIDASIKKVGVFVDEKIEVVIDLVKKYNITSIQLHGKESVTYIKELICHYEECQFERSREQNDVVISNKKTDCHDFQIKSRNDIPIDIIKVFSIINEFDFSVLEPYEDVVDYFLFDTKGKLPGGNGYTFDWSILEQYPSTKPYFLSGGIGLNEVEKIKAFKRNPASKHCYALDVNSKFEMESGLKNIDELEKFKVSLRETK